MIIQRCRPAVGTTNPAPWLRTVQTAYSTLVVDYRTGAVTMLSGETKHTWDAYVAGRHNGPDTAADPIITDFAERGWLAAPPIVVHLDDAATSWGTQETAAALPAIGHAPWRWRLAALPAVLLVLLARDLSHQHRFARLLWLTCLGEQLPLASDQQARHAVRAIRHAARLIPARVACLEESVAATVLLAAAGKRTRWCHGIATDPVRLHAWVAGRNGDPIEEPSSTARYTVINEPWTKSVKKETTSE
jgi:hypothetical protein